MLPYGNLDVEADASTSLPRGLALAAGREDAVTGLGDAALGASFGWHHRNGDRFRAYNLYTTVFAPTGSYEVGRIANLGANRRGLDLGTAFTMGNFKRGRGLSGVLGVTFTARNRTPTIAPAPSCTWSWSTSSTCRTASASASPATTISSSPPTPAPPCSATSMARSRPSAPRLATSSRPAGAWWAWTFAGITNSPRRTGSRATPFF